MSLKVFVVLIIRFVTRGPKRDSLHNTYSFSYWTVVIVFGRVESEHDKCLLDKFINRRWICKKLGCRCHCVTWLLTECYVRGFSPCPASGRFFYVTEDFFRVLHIMWDLIFHCRIPSELWISKSSPQKMRKPIDMIYWRTWSTGMNVATEMSSTSMQGKKTVGRINKR